MFEDSVELAIKAALYQQSQDKWLQTSNKACYTQKKENSMLVKVTPLNTKSTAPVYTTPLKWVLALRAYGLKNLEIERTETAIFVKYQGTLVQKVEAVEPLPTLKPA